MKTYNFSAGPSALFPQVVQTIKDELFDWQGTGSSVFEISHRSVEFMDLYRKLIDSLRQVLNLNQDYEVLFFQGGARGQFESIAQNLKLVNNKALYLISGHWSRTAAKLANKQVPQLEVVTMDLTNSNGKLVKRDWTKESENMDYVHYCMNETVDGIEIFDDLQFNPNTVLVCDMSSNICSRPVDMSKFDVVYAGAQKNVGISGLTLVFVKKSLLGHSKALEVLNWDIASKNDSMINTPCTFAMYVCYLTVKHLLDNFKNLETLGNYNQEKAQELYDYLDSSSFYTCKVDKSARSKMNVCFTTGSDELDTKFVADAKAQNLKYLKGHKVVGGLRASIYNAVDLEAVRTLISFMKKFAEQNS